MAANEDIYIKSGKILRGTEAAEELCIKDVNEIIQESGLEPALKASCSQTPAEDTSTEDEDIKSLIDKIMKKS